MGDIVRFRPRQGASRPAAARAENGAAQAGGAQILLFLGVRYERHEEVAPVGRKGQVKRGRPKKRA
jgi:hypothetical protein